MAKEAVQRAYIAKNIVEISSQYRCLIHAINQFGCSTFTISEVYRVTIAVDFGID